MEGIYRFYQDGELIGEAKNSLTVTGRALAIKTLLGAVPNFGTSLAIGVGQSANTAVSGSTLIANLGLDFEVGRFPIMSSHLEVKQVSGNSVDALIYKSRIDDPSAYKISEIGLYSDALISVFLLIDTSRPLGCLYVSEDGEDHFFPA
jgi:hypothetical protein